MRMFSVRVNLAIALPVGERDRRFNLVSYRQWAIAELAAIATKKAGLIWDGCLLRQLIRRHCVKPVPS